MKHNLSRLAWCLFILAGTALLSVRSASAEMKELSMIQSGIFHVSPAPFTSETDKSDRYIDDEQADFFIAAAEAEIYLPADHDNYPFSVVDHNILDSDLVIQRKPDSVLFPETEPLYLSRHNISKWEYTDLEPPHVVVKPNVIAPEPFNNQQVKAIVWESHKARIEKHEVFTKYGYMQGAEAITSGGVASWRNPDTPPRLPESADAGSKNQQADSP